MVEQQAGLDSAAAEVAGLAHEVPEMNYKLSHGQKSQFSPPKNVICSSFFVMIIISERYLPILQRKVP